MEKYIGLGQLNKNHIYIILSIICLIIKDIISGYNYNDSFIEVLSIEAHENFGTYNLINHIFCYIGTFILSIILYILEMNYLKKPEKTNESNNSLKEGKSLLNKKLSSDSKIVYIHHKVTNMTFSKNTFYCFIFLIFIWIVEEHLIEIYTFLKDLDFWMLEIIIVTLLNSKMFNLEIFRHQKLTLFFNIIPVILKVVTIILSVKDEGNKDNLKCGNIINYQYDYSCECFNDNITKMNNNTKEINCESNKLKNLYVIFIWLIPVGIIGYLLLITLRSYINSKLKWFMDLKYMPANKLLMTYGFLGAILCCITCTITTFAKCEETTRRSKSFYDYLCIVNINDGNKTQKYFDSFSIYFHELKPNEILNEILRLFFQILFYFLNKYFSICIIKFFTPVHLILSFPVYYIIQKIILIINTLIRNGTFFNNKKFNFKIAKFCLDVSGDITSFIGFLVYLEIIELNFCKLNYNLRRTIITRGNKELFDDINDHDDFDDTDERKSNEGKNKELELEKINADEISK